MYYFATGRFQNCIMLRTIPLSSLSETLHSLAKALAGRLWNWQLTTCNPAVCTRRWEGTGPTGNIWNHGTFRIHFASSSVLGFHEVRDFQPGVRLNTVHST